MKIRTINYMIKQGFIGIWRNRGMSIASISSVAASLAVLGVIITIVLNINNLSYIAQMQFDTIQVYLEDELTVEEISTLGQDITAIPGVQYVEYESKEDALNKMKEQWGEQGHLLDVLEDNTLPNSYVIHVENIEVSDDVVKELNNFAGIEEVKYHKDIVDNMLRIANFIRAIGLGLILILILVAMFIIANTIKLTLNARKQEINIMKYVGATNWFIRWPFFIEGMVLGLIGAVIALIFVHYGYQYTFDLLTTRFYVMLSVYVVSVEEMMSKTIPVFTVLGAGVGALGSIVSLRKHLRV
ncbi:cell division protein FtsX [Natronincola peptidivorans]|uniref:Cell division protein FtsX n=1 Tax=Natronincola peptidivorans TaxID=426128 RepID=A0A1I0BE59_9FIRM|nr:permease-like cell division protein FtsX [Natronincola peptidivorans]SET05237.1 cell division protein FtsX [Natronincola peptidivorans]